MAKWQEEFEIMAEKMDKRHTFLSMLYKQFPTLEECPEKWKPNWLAFKADGFKNWRHMPKVVKRVKRAAKRAAK